MPSYQGPMPDGSTIGSSGGSKMAVDPITGEIIGGALNFLGAGLFGGQPDPVMANLHLVNPGQQALWNQMAKRVATGAGDFGFGQGAKTAKGQVQQFMADRGVSMDSGYAGAAMGDAFANAAAQDEANRTQVGLSLLGTPLQTAQTAGANLIPGSPSAGYSQGAQEGSWNQTQQTGFTPGAIGDNGFNGKFWGPHPTGWNAPAARTPGYNALATTMTNRGFRRQPTAFGNG